MMSSVGTLCDNQILQSSVVVRVPAKAMLFGEYGVLFGGVALTAVLPSQIFELEARLEKREKFQEKSEKPLEFESELAGGVLFIRLADIAEANSLRVSQECAARDTRNENDDNVNGLSSVKQFLIHALVPLYPKIALIVNSGFFLKLKVTEAFSPSLGLGSSSAMIVSLYRAVEFLSAQCESLSVQSESLQTQSSELELQRAWPTLYSMLKSAQGPGSGYDIAAQFAASICYEENSMKNESRHGKIYAFRQVEIPELSCLLTEVKAEWFWKRAGFLIPSGVTASTGSLLKNALKNFQGAAQASGSRRTKQSLEDFARAHASVSSEALEILLNEGLWKNLSGRHPFAELFRRSLELALQQGIAGHLLDMDLPFETLGFLCKTMGAGMGDSIWCIPEYEIGAAQGLTELGKGAVLELN